MNLISTLADNINSLGLYIRKLRNNKNLSIETVAEAAFLKPETIRRLEAGKTLPISDEKFKQLEVALGCKPNALLDKVKEHRKYISRYIEIYKNQIVSFVDALRIYQVDEIDRILDDTIYKWNKARKEGDKKMATRKMTAAKPAKSTAKSAPKRSVKAPAKTAPTKRATTSRKSK